MNYFQAVDFLYKRLPMFHRIGAAAYKADLSRTIALLEHLKNPERNFRSIHIAGTNGKGSVAHLIASILQESGYRTGLFTSPHLLDYRERIRIDGVMIPESYVIAFVEAYGGLVSEIEPSFFEYTTALAFKYFSEEKVDIAVIETGMGGRLDSTNVITPEVSVITNIGKDHMQFLGDTLEKIAMEKAGIIKKGIPVVIGETQAETRGIFMDKAKHAGSDILFADELFLVKMCKNQESDFHVSTFDISYRNQPYLLHVTSPLTGIYQKKNLATTIAAVEMLRKAGYAIAEDSLKEGIRNCVANTGIRGRWEVVGQKPLTVFDVGHNADGLTYVVEQIRKSVYKNLHIIFGCVEDKDIGAILDILPGDALYYFCKADIPRGMEVEKLAGIAWKHGLHGIACNSVREAFSRARSDAAEEDMVVVTGSFFVVAEALAE